MRDYLIKHGAEFRFQTCLKDIQIKENALHALVTEDDTVIPESACHQVDPVLRNRQGKPKQ